MALSITDARPFRWLAPSLTGWLLLTAAAVAPAAVPRASQAIALDAASSDFDYKNNSLRFHQVTLKQGILRVEAAEALATGLNFENSQWSFRGSVRITTADGTLTSDLAEVNFQGNTLARAVITGAPATFEQQRPATTVGGKPRLVRGKAGRIDYDLAAATVRLSEAAWLSDGANEITGRTLVYGLQDQRVLANPGEQSSERVRITIQPPSSAEIDAKKPTEKQKEAITSQDKATTPTKGTP